MRIPARNDRCWCGSGKKYKDCHVAFDTKIKNLKKHGKIVPDHSIIKNQWEIQGIRDSAKINVAVLDYVAENIRAGVTTEEINRWVHEKTTQMGGIPAPLGYGGFPKSVCTSINHVVCHGIPSEDVVLKDGDIVNVDVSTILNGYYSDSSRMFMIGEVSEERKRLVEIAKRSIEVGLEQVKPWGFLGDMGQAINDYVKSMGCTVVREIGGHGIGLEFHEDPWVSYVSHRGQEMVMAPGMVFTIEPMVNAGGADVYVDEEDEWTVYTADGSDSAQWEVQVLVTENGYEILAY